MEIIIGISVLITGIYIIQHCVYAWLILSDRRVVRDLSDEQLPSVCLCMAARDEEACIAKALQALSLLDYPKDKLEIWIADDDSSDGTAGIIQEFIEERDGMHYYLVDNKFEGIRGKQNALANVIKKSRSKVIAIVDADTEVRIGWLREMVKHLSVDISMVCGVTSAKYDRTLLSLYQQFDWVYAGVLFRTHSRLGIPMSGLGNNMIYYRTAYEEVGGYESMKYCLNEDFRIFSEMCEKNNHGFYQVMNERSTNRVVAIESFRGTVEQRYRWLKGWKDMKRHNKMAILASFCAHFSIVIAFVAKWEVALFLLGLKLSIDVFIRFVGAKKVGEKPRILYTPIWAGMTFISGLLVPFCLIYANKITWRGRRV